LVLFTLKGQLRLLQDPSDFFYKIRLGLGALPGGKFFGRFGVMYLLNKLKMNDPSIMADRILDETII
jgi:hypothetical protein